MPRIEDWYLSTDGNDWLPAITRAQQEFHMPGDPTGTPGFTLEFGPSQYFFSDTIRLVRSMHLIGAAGKMFSTVFKFAPDKGGILCAWQLDGPGAFRSDSAIIERILLQGGGGTSATAHGITMNVKVALRDLAIAVFPGDGIHIEATHPFGNANNWHISNVQINNCGGDGLSVAGGDANSGYANLLVIQDSRGWAIRDHSAELGNTYISCVVEGNRSGAFNTRRDEGDSPRSIFINCDAEGNGPLNQSILDTPATLINCAAGNVVGDAVILRAAAEGAVFGTAVRAQSSLEPQLSPAPPGTVRQAVVTLGSTESIVCALRLQVFERTTDSQGKENWLQLNSAGNYELLYNYPVGEPHGWWGLHFNKEGGSAPLKFSTREADVGEAQIWFEQGLFMGSMLHITASGSSDTNAPSGPGRKSGDVVFNTDPEAGGHVGWVWVVPAGSTGTWKRFGQIEP